ncbi:hypothetical protein OROMI_030769 [Orobanche minor]
MQMGKKHATVVMMMMMMIPWQTDTSALAAQQRIQEQLNDVMASMVMISTGDDKPKSGKKSPEFKKYLKSGSSAGQLKLFLLSLSGTREEVLYALFQASFEGVEKGFAKEFEKKKNSYIAAALLQEVDRSFLWKSSPKAVKEAALVLKEHYDGDLLEEESVVE